MGLDFWPGYALLIALGWSLVPLAAWHLWRRHDVDPYFAAAGGVALAWLGTASWIQFSHAGVGVALAATIVALRYDEAPLSPRPVLISLSISVFAVLTTSIGALAVLGRAIASAAHRKWTGLAATVPVLLGYLLWRPNTGLEAGLADLPDVPNVIFRMLGGGVTQILPLPLEASWLIGLVVVGLLVATFVASRLSFKR